MRVMRFSFSPTALVILVSPKNKNQSQCKYSHTKIPTLTKQQVQIEMQKFPLIISVFCLHSPSTFYRMNHSVFWCPKEENSFLIPICPTGWAENRGSFQLAFFAFHGEAAITYQTKHFKGILKTVHVCFMPFAVASGPSMKSGLKYIFSTHLSVHMFMF